MKSHAAAVCVVALVGDDPQRRAADLYAAASSPGPGHRPDADVVGA